MMVEFTTAPSIVKSACGIHACDRDKIHFIAQ